jgi:integrase
VSVKRAKIIGPKQFPRLLKEIQGSGHTLRDEVALRLSFFAGLRAGEIAGLRWKRNLLDADGELMDEIHITSDIGKNSVERAIPIDPKLRLALLKLRRARPEDVYVFYALHNNVVPTDEEGQPVTEQGQVTSSAVVQWFKRLYARAGFEGCTSHTGRRTFITSRARIANLEGCSIVDVQRLAGHRRLQTTATYVESSPQQRDLVSAWG